MTWHGGTVTIRALAVSLAVLLPAATWAAATVDPQPPTTVLAAGRAGTTGFGQAALLDEVPAATDPVAATVAPLAPVPTGPTTTRATTASTKPAPATTTTSKPEPTTTTTTLPAVLPGNIRPASSWKADVANLSLRVRMEPAAPVAGQAVQFHIDVTATERCCHLFVQFGDNQAGWILHDQLVCTFEHELTPGTHSVVVSHTYAEAGAYLADVRVHDGSMCEPFPAEGPPFNHIEMQPCLAVGPGPEGAKGCKPPNLYPFLPPPR